jgi:PAS domain-containing protein
MAFKIKHVDTRFRLQSIFLLLLVGSLVFVLFLSSARKKNTLVAISVSNSITSEIQQFKTSLDKVIAKQISDADFVDFGCEELISENSSKISAVSDSVKSLKNLKFLRKSLNKNLLADSLVIALENFDHAFEIALLSLKEKGNQYAGRVGNANSLNQLLLDELKKAPDKGVQAIQLSIKSTEYFSSLNIIKLISYKDFCENISNTYAAEFPNFDNLVIGDYSSQIAREISNIEQIDKRLYNDEFNKGQIFDVNSAFNKLIFYSSELNQSIQIQSNHYFRFWIIVFLIVALVFSCIYILTGQQFSSKLKRNIKTLLNTTRQFKAGDFEKGPSDESFFEFEDFFANLDSLRLSLTERIEFVERILVNDFSYKIELLGVRDKLTQKLIDLHEKLYLAQQEQDKRDSDNEIRRYINEGLAKFGDIMRVNSNNTVALGDNLIKELVKYLGALQGGLFLTDETDTGQIHLISAFAYDRKKYLTKIIRVGEGLIGTCAIEKKTIHLTEVPKDYVLIKSGLGDTPPSNILVVPVLHENDMVGVIEIASLKLLNEYEIELAEQIASSLASTIITVRNNTKTAQLLEKSQQQAAEMAEQEEEMRQNMEELKATQEESARREEEMQGILDAIGSNFYVIEYSIDGTISHVNERVLKFINEPYESVIGRKHTEVFSVASELNTKLFNEIDLQKESKNIAETLNWGSKTYLYKHYLSPVISKYGDVIKILNILTIEEVKNSKNKR